MTVHQSKGLGFDMVIADGLDKKGRTNNGTRIALGPEAKAVEWGVVLPPKEFALQDDILRRQIEIEDAETKYGKICNAYVALTRAKKALYVLTTELGENSKTKNFARFLTLQFANSPTEFGNPNWFEAHALLEKGPDAAIAPRVFQKPIHGTPRPVFPSSFKHTEGTSSTLGGFSLSAAELGTEVHGILARIEWLDESDPHLDNPSDEALELVKVFLAKPETRRIFTRPSMPVALWCEQAFDLMLDGQWVSGIFDRVEIHRSHTGTPTSAQIYEFKTDHGTDREIHDRYANQMTIYRQAAAKLLGLDEESVKSRILRVR
jgi:ATP-dependent helicase/nuclease subunit A